MYSLKHKTKSTVTLLIASFLMFVFCIASPAEAVRVKHKNKHRVSSEEYFTPWSLQIAIDGAIDDDGEDYSGVQFSLNHFFTPAKALRFTLGVGDHDEIYDDNKLYRRSDAVYLFDNYTEFDVTSVEFSLQGMFYSSPLKEPRFYFGMGPKLGISDANPSVFVSYDEPYDWMEEVYYNDGALLTFGLEGSFGFEMFFGPNLSMIAEYGVALQKEWYILEFDYYDGYGHVITETETFGGDFHLDGSRIKLGMSLYF